jgi:hypothetical protein
MAKACLMALCTFAAFVSTHLIIPPAQPIEATANNTTVENTGEMSGFNIDSGEPMDVPSYAVSGLSRFNMEQLDYVLQLDLLNKENSSDPDD